MPDTRLDADELWVRGVRTRPSDGEFGSFLVAQRATAAFRRAIFEDGAFAGIFVGDGADITLEDAIIRRVDLASDGFGQGVYASGAQTRLSMRRVVVEDVRDSAVRTFGAQVDATDIALRDVRLGVGQVVRGYGMVATDGSAIRVQGGLIQRLGRRAVVAIDPGTTVDLVDVRIGEMLFDDSESRLTVFGQARLSLERVWLEAEGGVFAADPGTALHVRDFTYRAPSPPPTVRTAAIFAVDGVRTVTATAVDVTGGPAVAISDPETRVQIRGLRVRRQNGSRPTAFILDGTFELREAELVDAGTNAGILIDDGTLIVEDLAVAGSGDTIIFSTESRVDVARVRVDEAADQVLLINGGTATVNDLLVDRPLGDPDVGATIGVTNGATVSFSRVRLRGVTGTAWTFWEGSRGTFEDIEIDARDDPVSIGLSASDDSRLEVSRLSARNFFVGLSLSATKVTLRDVYVSGGALGSASTALAANLGRVEIQRGVFEDLTGWALAFYGQVDAQLDDVVIRNIEPIKPEEFSAGILTLMDAKVAASRLDISTTRTVAYWANDTSRTVLRDVKISDPLAPACPDASCQAGSLASAVWARSEAIVDIERFELIDMFTAAIQVTENGQVDARLGILSNNTFGILAEGTDYDPGRATDQVEFSDNNRDVVSRETTLPPVRFDPTAVLPTVD